MDWLATYERLIDERKKKFPRLAESCQGYIDRDVLFLSSSRKFLSSGRG